MLINGAVIIIIACGLPQKSTSQTVTDTPDLWNEEDVSKTKVDVESSVISENENFIKMRINDGEFSATRLKLDPTFKNLANLKVKSRFVVGNVATVTKRSNCLLHCTRQAGGNSQVFQITKDGVCTCTSVPPRYLLLFRRRYLELATDQNAIDIFYRTDCVRHDFTFTPPKPLLFYALDDVSGTTNLGSLDADRYSAQFKTGGNGHFDCDWSGTNRPKLMRSVPAENPWLHAVYDTLSLSANDMTSMAWFKKRDPRGGPQMPVVEAVYGNAFSFSWDMWVAPSYEKLYWGSPLYSLTAADSFTLTTWNHMALTISATNHLQEGFVNATRVGTAAVRAGDGALNDRINIGRRIRPGQPNLDVYWDGCLAHFMLFDRKLSNEEIKTWADLVSDDIF